ncbi:Spermidine synthase [Paramuricea clavata]|uniref:Spermidine synthase n=1 Tax=Paramuricea clavata TaxID=317549 RepID=A0A6S7FVI5_PARCT|nr:Spermidine synthase [Paramuricea clavata]
MAKVENGWFAEISDLWYGQAMSFEVNKVLCHKKSQYQDILMFESKSHGNVLVLDSCVQCTDRDEFSYQEMITYLPLNSHPNPRKVLVIGAGDGGVIREIAKHPCVESIVQCEIDEEVVNMSKKYLPNMSCGYNSAKHTLHVGCGKEFMKKHQGEFDVIITDSSDPVGPAASLFEKEYYELMKSALKSDGILCSQGECPWLDNVFIKNMMKFCSPLFPVVGYAYTNVPTYPCGQIGFLMCSRSPETKFDQPLRRFSSEQLTSLNLKFYNSEMHTAAFALPQFFEKKNKEYDKTGSSEDSDWFWEKRKIAPGQSFGLIKEDIHFHKKINNQDILVFNSYVYGNVLVVDDVIQRTECDQALYDESLAHLALSCHPDPKKVLIIGGLSGGIINEVSRYQSVEEIVQCEASQALLDISKKYFDQTSTGYENPKLRELYIGTYMEYIKTHPVEYDVIITVPAETFLQPNTSDALKSALKPNGIVISQLPSFWLELDAIHSLFKYNKTSFSTVKLAYSCIPTPPFGQTTFMLRSLNPATCFETPVQQLSDEEHSQLYFYNSKVHSACFALPEFVRKVIDS